MDVQADAALLIPGTPQTIALVAGEPSGDILGASLMRALKARCPGLTFVGVGGPLMEAEGLQSLFPLDRLAVMGIVDVIKNLPDLLAARKQVVQAMLSERPDIFVGIDAPDFTIPIEAKLKKAGMITVHYVSPSVWAWRQKRVFKIAAATHNVLCLLPFEKQFYDRFEVPATFVGHTLADEIPLQSSRDEAIARLQLDPAIRYVGLLPGSRRTEVGMLAPTFLQAAKRLHAQHPQLEFLIPVVNDARKAQLREAMAEQGVKDLPIHIYDGQSRDVMLASEALILASGTVALEAMLLKRPMVVAYKFSRMNYQLLRWLVKLDHFSLPNLLAGEPLVPELLQDEVTGDNLARITSEFLQHPPHALIERFKQLHRAIQLNAAETAAEAVLTTYHEILLNRK
ncbi:lipid-A-disaccharide synthase [Aliidiomarina soli]|uniref:lipid-A-disaccharide synthase n=1 Tax=Aliidiomarina soli TaxID=1928574 RepID=UPI001F545801|nr:lipid-A-disaccharide synthase [Aliidiomarina soli]